MPELAVGYLFKAYKSDIVLFELDLKYQQRLTNWKGRLLMNNLMSYAYATHFKDYIGAVSFMQTSLAITDTYLSRDAGAEDSLIGSEVQ
jgi:hypothetical protein